MIPAAVTSPRSASVRLVLDVPAREAEDAWGLGEETLPESTTHRDTVLLLELILRAFVARTRRNALVAANLACRWDPDHPTAGVDPDVALIEPAPPGAADLPSLRTWEPGHVPPRFAIEVRDDIGNVVSDSNARKGHLDGPARYARLGTRELLIFDPGHVGPPGFNDVLQVWRRDDAGSTTTRVYAGDGPAYSEELGAWLFATTEQRLRIADDPDGRALWLTEAEASGQKIKTREQALRPETAAPLVAFLRTTIEDLCEAYGVPLDDARRAHLHTLDLAGLEALRVHLKRDRAWPA